VIDLTATNTIKASLGVIEEILLITVNRNDTKDNDEDSMVLVMN